ncbi:MAG: hypothetical protein R2709_15355 [Marmoricola sp.]
MDLKQQHGRWTVSRKSMGLVHLGAQMEPEKSLTTSPYPTDSHDSVLLPNGNAVLMSYAVDPATQLVHAVIQEVDGTNHLFHVELPRPHRPSHRLSKPTTGHGLRSHQQPADTPKR